MVDEIVMRYRCELMPFITTSSLHGEAAQKIKKASRENKERTAVGSWLLQLAVD